MTTCPAHPFRARWDESCWPTERLPYPARIARQKTATLRANQLRLYFASFAYVLLHGLRRLGLAGTRMARAQCGTLRVKLLKIAARPAPRPRNRVPANRTRRPAPPPGRTRAAKAARCGHYRTECSFPTPSRAKKPPSRRASSRTQDRLLDNKATNGPQPARPTSFAELVSDAA